MNLLGTIGALVVMLMMLPMLTDLIDTGLVDMQKRQAADHLSQVNKAAASYMRKHHERLKGQCSATGGPDIGIADLITEEFLPAGFREFNVWGQGYRVYLRQPKATEIQAVTLTTGGRDNEKAKFATAVIPSTAMLMGGAGGFVPSGDIPSQPADSLHGASGGWAFALASMGIPSPGAGHLGALASIDPSALGHDFLYRMAVPGHPELNQMQTELDMTDHAIRNISELQFTEREISSETCTTPEEQGRVFLDRVQGLYLCRNNSLEIVGDSGNSAQVKEVTLASSGDIVTKPSCAPGTNTVPMIFVAPAIAEIGPDAPPLSAFQVWATSLNDTQWQVQLRLLSADKTFSPDGSGWVYPEADYGRIMAVSLCAKGVTP